MKTTAEKKIEISNVRITYEEEIILVKASKLSLDDDFMSYKTKSLREQKFKDTLADVIKAGIEDFYRPIMDPSFTNEEETKIHYKAGEKPAVGKSYNEWANLLKDTDWCLGTKSQYVAFIGMLIKKLVAIGWTVEEAWDAVCNNSEKWIKHWNFGQLKGTGSIEICGFFDLAYNFKILAKDEEIGGFWLAGSYGDFAEYDLPLTDLGIGDDYDEIRTDSVPWLVLKK